MSWLGLQNDLLQRMGEPTFIAKHMPSPAAATECTEMQKPRGNRGIVSKHKLPAHSYFVSVYVQRNELQQFLVRQFRQQQFARVFLTENFVRHFLF